MASRWEVRYLVEVEVVALCNVEPAERGTPRSMHGPGTPDWPAAAQLVEVRIGTTVVSADILGRADIEAIEAQAVEEYEDEQHHAGDCDADDRRDALRDAAHDE